MDVPQPGKHPSRILLVEDDNALANVYITRLQGEGFDVRRVENGEDALAAALSYKPDLVLLDVMMPKVSGFDVLDILRNTPETANLKIIMLTAQPAERSRPRQSPRRRRLPGKISGRYRRRHRPYPPPPRPSLTFSATTLTIYKDYANV